MDCHGHTEFASCGWDSGIQSVRGSLSSLCRALYIGQPHWKTILLGSECFSKAGLGSVLIFAIPAAKKGTSGQKQLCQPSLTWASFLSDYFFPCEMQVLP